MVEEVGCAFPYNHPLKMIVGKVGPFYTCHCQCQIEHRLARKLGNQNGSETWVNSSDRIESHASTAPLHFLPSTQVPDDPHRLSCHQRTRSRSSSRRPGESVMAFLALAVNATIMGTPHETHIATVVSKTPSTASRSVSLRTFEPASSGTAPMASLRICAIELI